MVAATNETVIEKGYTHHHDVGFGKSMEGVMHDLTLTDGAARLYSHMHWRYGSNHKNYEGRASMSDFMGVTETTITNRVKELVARDWVIVIPQYDDRGRITNFYHVFEEQNDCRKWQNDHNYEKQVIKFQERKQRKGIGGRPTHKVKEDVSKETQVSIPVSELEFPTVGNSSSRRYPDSYYPDSLNTEDSSEPANAVRIEPSDSTPSEAKGDQAKRNTNVEVKVLEEKEKSSAQKEKETCVVDVRSADWQSAPPEQRVYIGRNTFEHKSEGWGNPYIIGDNGTRADVIAKYREYLLTKPDLLKRIGSLRGKTLGCWCKDDSRESKTKAQLGSVPCHGDVLAEFASFSDAELDELITLAQNEAQHTKPVPTNGTKSSTSTPTTPDGNGINAGTKVETFKVGDRVDYETPNFPAVIVGFTPKKVKILSIYAPYLPDGKPSVGQDRITERSVEARTLKPRTHRDIPLLDSEAERRVAAERVAGVKNNDDVPLLDGWIESVGKDTLPAGFSYGPFRRTFTKAMLKEGKTKEDLVCAGLLYKAYLDALPGTLSVNWEVGAVINEIRRALALCKDGITSLDVEKFIKEKYAETDKNGKRFWAGKLIKFEHLADNVGIWKGDQEETGTVKLVETAPGEWEYRSV